MVTWAARRRILYILSILIPLFLIVLFVGFIVWYEEPTCFDGKENGDEVGQDCGGSCRLLCSSQALPPEVLWSRAFEVVPGVYNLVAYIENPNIRSEVEFAPYSFKMYDQNNELIFERTGITSLPQRKTFAIFEGTVRTNDRVPVRTTFEFTRDLSWQKVDEADPDIEVQSTVLIGTENSPRINAVLENQSIDDLEEVEVTVIIFDSNNNAIHSSQTIVEDLARNTSKNIVFTWPQPFITNLGVCANSVDVALVVDRSGSMNDDSDTPPEPLTTVKLAAQTFVEQLSEQDQVSIISFATEGSLDSPLTKDVSSAIQAITDIVIQGEDATQHTNIFDGLQIASNELTSERNRLTADDVIVLLTDGIASRPQESNNPDYAEEVAVSFAEQIKERETEIYTIGLGLNVNNDFLRAISTEEQYYYTAPTREDVKAIYEEIATSICQKGPNVIQIIPRVIE